MNERSHKVIGYFAYASNREVICTGPSRKACLISGSDIAMRNFLKKIDHNGLMKHTIKKTRFGEILRGLKLGAEYAFDEVSYERFYPLASREEK